jgi:hypothetical protein
MDDILVCWRVPGEDGFVGAGRYVDSNIWTAGKRLIIDRQALTKVYSAEPHHRVFARFVVRTSAENLLADHPFPKQG